MLSLVHQSLAALTLGNTLEVLIHQAWGVDALQEWCLQARYEFLGTVADEHETRCLVRKGGAVPRVGERPISSDSALATDYTWSARVRWASDQHASVYTGDHAFSVGSSARFTEKAPHPSAVEYLLGALGGDLVTGFQRQAARRGVTIDALEVSISGSLDNVLVSVGVVGAQGHPGFESITATLYVGADADETTLHALWRATLATSPLVNTLEHCVALSLRMQVTL